jgi:hypothetical protein
MMPVAAPARFPYKEHRTLAEVDAQRQEATDGRWIVAFWPHLEHRKDGGWVISRFNPRRNAWQCQSTASTKWYVRAGSYPTKWQRLTDRPDWLVGR